MGTEIIKKWQTTAIYGCMDADQSLWERAWAAA